jgi:hypothetical protein
MTIYQSFQAGGWAMYFILAFGLLAVYGAARFFWQGQSAFERFSRTLMQTTALSALFGFLVDMIHVAGYIVEHTKTLDERVATQVVDVHIQAFTAVRILIEGTGESLNTLTLGLLLITLSSLLLGVGQRRFPTSLANEE